MNKMKQVTLSLLNQNSGIFESNKEMIEVCYSSHEAEQIASITNFAINPVIN